MGLFDTSPSYNGPAMTAAQWRQFLSGPYAYALMGYEPKWGDILPDAPGPKTDLTDDEVLQARLAARQRIMLGAGQDSTFLSGPLGISTTPSTLAPKAGGI